MQNKTGIFNKLIFNYYYRVGIVCLFSGELPKSCKNQFYSTLDFDEVGRIRKVLFNHLSQREKQVLFGISQEKSLSSISRNLVLSLKTVSTHKRNAMRKLKFKRDVELYYWLSIAREGGWGVC
ncbi:response regulator transcription factor [Serratia marcescens]